jgi:hypothetical protein
MTYVIPAVLCWALAVSLAGKEWIAWDGTHLKVSWSIPIILVTAAIVVVALWPPGVLRLQVLKRFSDISALVTSATNATLGGGLLACAS